MRRIKKAGAFTLVELLVVIGIIALLISILMPALGRARMSAQLLSCQSNMRQIYNAIAIYAANNGGLMPISSMKASDGGYDATNHPEYGQGTNAIIFIELTKVLGKRDFDAKKDKLNSIFTCTEALDPSSGITWAPNLVRTVKFNPRGFPGADQLASYPDEYPARKLSSVRKNAEKIAFWDGPQIPTWNMCPEPLSIFCDNWRWNWGHWYADPAKESYDDSRMDLPLDSGPNKDDGWWICAVRYRHMKNTVTPVAFFDGHVESRKIGEIKVKDICLNRK